MCWLKRLQGGTRRGAEFAQWRTFAKRWRSVQPSFERCGHGLQTAVSACNRGQDSPTPHSWCCYAEHSLESDPAPSEVAPPEREAAAPSGAGASKPPLSAPATAAPRQVSTKSDRAAFKEGW